MSLFVVTILSLPNCHFCELTKLSLPNCHLTKLSLPNCHYQIVITKSPPVAGLDHKFGNKVSAAFLLNIIIRKNLNFIKQLYFKFMNGQNGKLNYKELYKNK